MTTHEHNIMAQWESTLSNRRLKQATRNTHEQAATLVEYSNGRADQVSAFLCWLDALIEVCNPAFKPDVEALQSLRKLIKEWLQDKQAINLALNLPVDS